MPSASPNLLRFVLSILLTCALCAVSCVGFDPGAVAQVHLLAPRPTIGDGIDASLLTASHVELMTCAEFDSGGAAVREPEFMEGAFQLLRNLVMTEVAHAHSGDEEDLGSQSYDLRHQPQVVLTTLYPTPQESYCAIVLHLGDSETPAAEVRLTSGASHTIPRQDIVLPMQPVAFEVGREMHAVIEYDALGWNTARGAFDLTPFAP